MVRLLGMNDRIPDYLCVLDPTVCTVSEEAGGSYELYLEHPEDPHEKYLMLAENMIIEAPVPPRDVPAITLPATDIMTVIANCDFWKKLPKYKGSGGADNSAAAKIRSNPTAYLWSSTKTYLAGDYVIYGNIYTGTIYRALQAAYGEWHPNVWQSIGPVDEGSSTPTYIPGEKYSPGLSQGAVISKVADYNSTYYQIRDSLGRVGYLEKNKTIIDHTESRVIPAQCIRTQLFRIYQVQGDDDTHTIKVNARHISYDFQGNRILDCSFSEAEPASAIASMQARLMLDDSREIACEYESDEYEDYHITRDWSFKSPIAALLDDNEGLVPFLRAKLIRNNRDFYILYNNRGIGNYYIVEYGVNLVGVSWTRNKESVVTRVVPRCNAKENDYLYLEHGGTWTDEYYDTWVDNDEIYVVSPIENQYPYPVIEVLDCNYSVGEKYIPPDSSEEVERTEESCREEMLNDAKRRFLDDHCDGIDITLSVEFLLLGDTEEYKQYRGLQRVNLYDNIHIKSKQFTFYAQVTGYEWDSLRERYNSVDVGKVNDMNRRVIGSRIVNETVTYNKLAPGLIRQIRSYTERQDDNQ